MEVNMIRVNNPIMAGFHPDPSICRVENKYYMVHSTFAYFPGVPIYQSEDMVHWTQIGNVLDRDSQLPLKGCGQSHGIFAPTIRYDRDTFYMITTNISAGGNFIVTAKSPEGPWSEPYFLGPDAMGIDPSLFFDTDGTCYYIGQREKKDAKYYGDCEVWIQKLNLETMKLEGDAAAVLDGFQKNAIWPEGPHLYHIDDYYYIIHAESGTAFHHSVMAARSRDIFGPYEYCPSNPIITHRHLGKDYPVTSVGHADLVDDGSGNWYMVMLACRPQEGHTLLGRETFLAKVVWEDGWPVVNPGIGRLEDVFEIPGEGGAAGDVDDCQTYTFDIKDIPPEFLSLRNNREKMMSLSARPGYLRMYMKGDTLKDLAEPAYLAVRQQHTECVAETEAELHFGEDGGCAGIALMQNNENHLRVERFREGGRDGIRVIRCVQGNDEELCLTDGIETKIIGLKVDVHGLLADVSYRFNEGWKSMISDIDIRPFSTESSGGFVGCTIGMYASGNGKDTGGYADFTHFTYQH